MNAQIQTVQMEMTGAKPVHPSWKTLYRTGGAAALLSLVFFPIQIIVFFLKPLPDTVIGWFKLFQESNLIGLLDLDLLLMADQVLAVLIFLALFIALRRTNESFMVIGFVLGLISVVLYIASNPAFEMLSVSKQYAAAATETERNLSLAAGQALIASWQGSAFQASYILGSFATIVVSAVMLQSRLFSKATGMIGILANTIGLGLYVPVIGIYISIFSVVFLWVWYLLVGLRLLQLEQ